MTEERKQELRQLLQEAMNNLEIRPRFTNPPLPSVDINQYKWHLRESWTSYSPNTEWLVSKFKLDISRDAESRLFEFIKEELNPFIYEDRILLGSFFVLGSYSEGVSLSELLGKLLKIAIFGEVEEAVLAFDKCTIEDASVSFEFIALLEGITLETEIQVFEGIRLVPLPSSGIVSELPRCLSSIVPTGLARFFTKTLLIIDYSIVPVFRNPYVPTTTDVPGTCAKRNKQREKFRVEVKGGKFPDYTNTVFTVFHQQFCQALSLACNSGVKFAMDWNFLEEDELVNINPENIRHSSSYWGPFGDPIKVGEAQIDEAKHLYEVLVDSTSNTLTNIAEKLQIPINRWIESKIHKEPVDKMIDLGTAFESLFLPSDNVDQLAFQFRLRASWLLGEGKAEREKLMDEFKAIYDLRSKAVHNGEVPKRIKIRKGESVPTSEFIPRAQDLCRQSIVKILEDGEFPDDDYWKDLILG